MSFAPKGAAIGWPFEVRTRRLILRAPVEADFQAWRTSVLGRNPPRHKYDRGPGEPAECTRRMWRRLLGFWKQDARADRYYVFFVFERTNGAFVGFVDLATIERKNWNSANLGYVFHNQFQRRGFATEAVKGVLSIAFTKLHYWRVEAACRLDNRASRGVARKAGMTREGIRRAYWRDPDGWADHVIYVALAPRETPAIRSLAGVPKE